ncbi:ABC transporter permease [Streptomyces cupreus]|uniref:ABC transporter permease n=1 Tax=Streptomyces cupreus TaxID=2759956 RepID=A0A7X1ME65_9ACTN|nr:ABC transporter permease [Streptomyces cupreus]MBC2907643.1 ABC transporter permease [Streptomyces cupreus]
MRSIWALAGKDLTVTRRSPTFLAITVLVPLIFVGLYALLVQVSATSPVAIAQEGTGPHSQRMVQVLRDMSSVDGEFFEIRTTDPDEARRMFDDGEIGAVLTIPADFDQRVEAGRPVAVPLQVFNINSDGTKNFQLRAEHAVRQFAADGGGSLATVKETSAFSEDMRITVYLGTGLLMFAILYASMVNTGTLVAREWEERTAKPLVLSPVGNAPFVLGKWLAAAVQTVVSMVGVLLGLAWLLDYPVSSLGWNSLLAMIVLFAYGAGFGALIGVALRKSLPMIPICVVLAVTHFFVSGYESYLRGFAHGGAVEGLWQATHWAPMGLLTDQMRFEVSGLKTVSLDWSAMGWTLAAAATLTTLAVVRMRRALSFSQGQ